MDKMNTYEQIIELLRLNKKPYLSLKRKEGLSVINAGAYRCENVGKDASIDEKIESSVKWLSDYVALFPKSTIFYLYMKSSENANQSGILGPFQFMLEPESAEEKENNLNGIPAGYVPEAELKYRLFEKEMQFERELHKRELEDLKKEFTEKLDFTINQAKAFSPEGIRSIVKEFQPIVAIWKGKEPPALSGTPEEEQDEPINDIKVASVNEFSRILYNEFSLKDIEKLKQLILSKKADKNKTDE